MRAAKSSQTKGLAVILSSPSGGGKSSIARALVAQDPRLVLSISVTTRQPRPGEIEGKQYFFRSRDNFLKMIKNNELLEYSEIYGNLYGIPEKFVKTQFSKGNNVVFDIDFQGADKLKKLLGKNVVSVFILPPSLKELRSRLETRNQDLPEEIDLRMNLAAKEISQAKNYDHVVINTDFAATVAAIYQLIQAERKKQDLS